MSTTQTQGTLAAYASPERLTLQYSEDITPHARFVCLQRFILESEERPLDLELDAQGMSWAMFGGDADSEDAHKLICDNVNRFTRLVLKCSYFCSLPLVQLDMLETLEVDDAIPIDKFPKAKQLRVAKVGFVKTPGTLFSDYPHLETLEMYADTLPGAPSVIPQGVPFGAIRRITFRQNEGNTDIGIVPSEIFHLPRGACIKFECATANALTAIFRAVRVVDAGLRLLIEDCAYEQSEDGQPVCVVIFRGSRTVLNSVISTQGDMHWEGIGSDSSILSDGPDSQRDPGTLVRPLELPFKQSSDRPILIRVVYTAGSLCGEYEAEQPSPAMGGDEQTMPNGSTYTVPV